MVGRFLHMGADPHNFVSALNCIVAQRLVRVLCRECREPAPPGPAETKALSALVSPSDRVFQPRGCRKCDGAGYRGRTVVAEVLPLSAPIRELILARKGVGAIRTQAESEGMVPLRRNALELVARGVTTLSEVDRVTARDG